MGNVFFLPWEPGFMVLLQQFMNAVTTPVIKVFSMIGEETILIGLFAFVYLCYDKKAGRFMGSTFLAACIWNPMIKNVALRLRPYFVHREIQILKPVDPSADLLDVNAQGYSFPSGHSTNAAVFYGSLAYKIRKNWLTITAMILTLLVGVSRVLLGAHYPTDVLCGWALGLLTILIVALLRKLFRGNELLTNLVVILTAVPGLFFCKTSDYFTGFGLLLGFTIGTFLEEKFVNFHETRNVLRILVRMVLCFSIYFGLNFLMKLPFSKEFLESTGFWCRFFRVVRYAIIIITEVFLLPLSFRIGDRMEETHKNRKKVR